MTIRRGMAFCARFMAGHWVTSAVYIVPVFEENGTWLEHFVFDVFYNFPQNPMA
jgi:hypothetical protein